jgi:pimeloyl-ACP methyl ester carboxylesterase
LIEIFSSQDHLQGYLNEFRKIYYKSSEHAMKQTHLNLSLFILFTSVLLLSLLVGSCGLLDSKENFSSGNLNGSVITNDTGQGIPNALIRVFDADSLTAEVITDESGEFSFQNVEPGEKTVRLTLPKGFLILDDPEKTVNIDGNISIEFLGEPVREITKTITPGTIDTLSTSSGGFLEIDASTSDRPLDISIEETEIIDSQLFNSNPVRISIRQSGQGKRTDGTYGFSNTMPSSSLMIGVKVWKFVHAKSKNVSFSFDVGSQDEPLLLYADTENTIYKDPNTGEERIVPLHSFDVPSDVDFETIMDVALSEDDCEDNPELRVLEPIAGYQEGERPLIFVHGWQPFRTTCEDFIDFDPVSETFTSLIEQLDLEVEVRSNYSFYKYVYPTNSPILAASDDLFNQIEEKGLIDPVIIGHSMGGLVGRGLMATHGSDKFRGLITLGTPHEGSPLADGLWILNSLSSPALCIKYPIYCAVSYLNGKIFPQTKGLTDLAVNSSFIQALIAAENDKNKVFTLGGNIRDTEDIDLDQYTPFIVNPIHKFSLQLASRLLSLEGLQHDGIVPLSSALPTWTPLQTSLSSHSHFNIHSTSEVVSQITPILSVLSDCQNPPARPASNDFNISGSVAREGERTIRVTLNALSVDGSVATDLSEDNFIVVENDCIRPISSFSADNVGVDIVFIQDLSGSMGGAISGVRSSVISFANDLASRGINAQFASIGYSGPGNIPTTPPTSTCEFLGPFQDLNDVSSFQSHVSNQWRATGGCDLPENGLEAIQYAHENVSWRAGAARVYINITDVSHHTAETNCNSAGPCTDQTLESILALVGETSTIHVIAPSSESIRTTAGGLDPWKLAEATGGEKLVLPSNGFVNLTDLGIAEVVGEAITFTFESASRQQAIHSLRIRAEINDKVAELAPALISYKKINPILSQIN